MNVCLVSLVTVWHGVGGGMEVHGRLLARGLARLGHHVTALSSRHPGGVARAVHEGVTHEFLPGTTFGSQRGAWAGEVLAAFERVHGERAVDVVLCQQAVLPPRLLARTRREGLPVVALLEGHEGMMLRSQARQALTHAAGLVRLPGHAASFAYHHLAWERPLLRRCDAVIAVSDEVRRSVVRWLGVPRERIDVVPNGVDVDAFARDAGARASLRHRLGIAPHARLLLFLSSVTRDKGLDVLLRALPRVLATQPDARLVVAGGGDHLDEARALTARLGLAGVVTFAGQVPHDETVAYFSACDAFVLPTLRQEGMPFAILEAMAARAPVVASRIGGVPSAVNDGETGLLVRPGDVNDLARAVLRVLDEPALAARLAQRARERATEAFSVDVMVRRTAGVLERARCRRPAVTTAAVQGCA
jgi:glycosyltransferase involved in cell wall biosynthesis